MYRMVTKKKHCLPSETNSAQIFLFKRRAELLPLGPTKYQIFLALAMYKHTLQVLTFKKI